MSAPRFEPHYTPESRRRMRVAGTPLPCCRLMERRGLGPHADAGEDTLRHDEPLLAELYGASVSGRIATGPRAGRRIARVGDEVDPEDGALPSGRCCASVEGFSVHAGVCIPARDRMRLERLARYAGRPPLATERLSLLPDGRLLYRLKILGVLFCAWFAFKISGASLRPSRRCGADAGDGITSTARYPPAGRQPSRG